MKDEFCFYNINKKNIIKFIPTFASYSQLTIRATYLLFYTDLITQVLCQIQAQFPMKTIQRGQKLKGFTRWVERLNAIDPVSAIGRFVAHNAPATLSVANGLINKK